MAWLSGPLSTWFPLWACWRKSSCTATTCFAAGCNHEIPLDHGAIAAGADLRSHPGTKPVAFAGAVPVESRSERAGTHLALSPAAFATTRRPVSPAEHARRG